MDGIAGIVYPDAFQLTHLIIPMLDTLRRSPSVLRDAHTWRNFQIGSSGSKLASNERKNIFGGMNGHITNKIELREELKKKGSQARNDGELEILIHAYETWGPGFIERVEGEFALVLLDHNKERLYLYRDRIGKKTLYWYKDAHQFIFASELKAMLATGAVPQAPSLEGLSAYLYFGYCPQDITPVRNVNKLLPSHYLSFDKHHSIQIIPYWSYSSYFRVSHAQQLETEAKHCDGLLKQAIKESVPHKGPVGCLMLGGITSAAIAKDLDEIVGKERIKAYATGFFGENDDDIAAAELGSAALRLPLHKEWVTPQNFLEDLVEICWQLDEPLADPNISAVWRIAKSASKEVKVLFSGIWADITTSETPHGLDTDQSGIADRLWDVKAKLIRSLLAPLFNQLYKPWAFKLLKGLQHTSWQMQYLRHNELFPKKALRSAAPALSNLLDPEAYLKKFYQLNKIHDLRKTFLYIDVKTRVTDSLLFQYERLSSVWNLSLKAPFIDRRMVEFLAGLPHISGGETAERELFQKRLLQRKIPAEFLNRKPAEKKDFLKAWVESTELGVIFQMLSKGALVESGLISEQWINQATATPAARTHNFRYLWTLLILDIWYRLFINKPIQQAPPKASILELITEK